MCLFHVCVAALKSSSKSPWLTRQTKSSKKITVMPFANNHHFYHIVKTNPRMPHTRTHHHHLHKSSTTQTNSRFSGLMSPCTIPLLCKCWDTTMGKAPCTLRSLLRQKFNRDIPMHRPCLSHPTNHRHAKYEGAGKVSEDIYRYLYRSLPQELLGCCARQGRRPARRSCRAKGAHSRMSFFLRNSNVNFCASS